MVVAVTVAGLIAWRAWPLIFHDREDFKEAMHYTLMPDWISLLRRQWFEDMAKSWKMTLYAGLIFLGGALSHRGVELLLGWWLQDAPSG